MIHLRNGRGATMADNNNIFNNVYAATKSGGNYVIGQRLSTQPATVLDADAAGRDAQGTLGDVSNDAFTYGGNTYTYEGSAGDGAFIASRGGNFYLFSDA